MAQDGKLTITLTDARPVRINKDKWPIIASASDSWHDGQYDFQANRTRDCKITVRQHDDGRTIVYAAYTYTTAFQGEDGASARGGEMFTTPNASEYCMGDAEPIIAAIQRVAADMQGRTGRDEFSRLAHECVADLPAHDLDDVTVEAR